MKYRIPVVRGVPLNNKSMSELRELGDELGYPFMIESRTEAYDGRANFAVRDGSQLQAAMDTLRDRPVYAEQWAGFELDLAVTVV